MHDTGWSEDDKDAFVAAAWPISNRATAAAFEHAGYSLIEAIRWASKGLSPNQSAIAKDLGWTAETVPTPPGHLRPAPGHSVAPPSGVEGRDAATNFTVDGPHLSDGWRPLLERDYDHYAIAKPLTAVNGRQFDRFDYTIDAAGQARPRTAEERADYFRRFVQANPAAAEGVRNRRARAAAWQAYCDDNPGAAYASINAVNGDPSDELMQHRASQRFRDYKDRAKAYASAHPDEDPSQWPQGWQHQDRVAGQATKESDEESPVAGYGRGTP
jgi:hypothetical protein